MPFLIGLQASMLPSLKQLPMDEVTLLDLDMGTCEPSPGSPRDDARLLPWSDRLQAALQVPTTLDHIIHLFLHAHASKLVPHVTASITCYNASNHITSSITCYNASKVVPHIKACITCYNVSKLVLHVKPLSCATLPARWFLILQPLSHAAARHCFCPSLS